MMICDIFNGRQSKVQCKEQKKKFSYSVISEFQELCVIIPGIM